MKTIRQRLINAMHNLSLSACRLSLSLTRFVLVGFSLCCRSTRSTLNKAFEYCCWVLVLIDAWSKQNSLDKSCISLFAFPLCAEGIQFARLLNNWAWIAVDVSICKPNMHPYRERCIGTEPDELLWLFASNAQEKWNASDDHSGYEFVFILKAHLFAWVISIYHFHKRRDNNNLKKCSSLAK